MDIKSSNPQINIRSRPLIFLDLETTGLIVQKIEILEIGAIKVESKKPFKVVDKLQIKVRPEKIEAADKEALKIVGYNEEEWKDAISLKEALNKLENFGKEGILVAYNTSFDWAVLDKAYFSIGKIDPFYYHRLDVMPMAYLKLFGKRSLNRFSLGEICKYLKIERETKHRALSDAWVTYLVFKKLFSLV